MSPAPVRILLVEDNPAEARLLLELLREVPDFPGTVVPVDRLASAVRHLAETQTDVVVLDLNLPDSDGLATLTAISEAGPEAAIVVLTGLADEEMGNEAIRRGAQDYLVKGSAEGPLLVRSIRYAHERKARENEMLKAESELNLLSRLTRGFTAAPTLETALESLLAEVRDATGWMYGESWVPHAGGRMILGPTCGAANPALAEFTSDSLGMTIGRGEGLVGRVWASATPLWVRDVTGAPEFLRRDRAGEAHLRSAMLVPVVAGADVVAILVFFDTRERGEDLRLLELVHAVASHAGGMVKRRQAEDALAASERRLRELMDSANDGVLLVDAEGTIEYANAQAHSLLDRPHDEVIGLALSAIFPGPTGAALAARVTRPRTGEGEAVETRLARPDGAERWVIASSSPATGDAGEFVGSLVMITDITRLKKAEEADQILADAGQIFASSLDPETIFRRLMELLVPTIGDACAVRLRGIPGLDHTAALGPDPAAEARLTEALDLLIDLLQANETDLAPMLRGGETLHLADLGESFLDELDVAPEQRARLLALLPTSVVVVPLTSGKGLLGLIGFQTAGSRRPLDESERALAEKLGHLTSLALENSLLYGEARAAIRSRDEVMGVVAHDLRSPLGAISMYSSLMGNPESETASREKWIAGIDRSVKYMDRLIQDLLDVTRLEAGKIRLERARIDVPALVGEVLGLFESIATGAEVRLQTEVEPGLPELLADPRRLLQAISNVLSNALRFTPAGGTVTVRARAEADAVAFTISDDGDGIPSDQLTHIFDRFWQGQPARRGGAGLGLSIVKGLVEAHGGTVSVSSEVGRGSEFRLLFPVDTAAPAEPEREAAGTARAARRVARAEPVRLVIADDHRVFLRSLEEVLTRSGWVDVVAAVTSGEQAIERTRSLRPDLVLMDLEMEGIGGLAAIRQISGFDPPIPVVALTAEPEERVLFLAIDAGVSGFLQKSTDVDNLLETIDAVLGGGAGFSPGSQRSVLAEFLEKRGQSPLKDLTERERAIITLVASGYNSAEIGRRLYLSPSTVDTYRSKLMRRLNLKHRSDLVHFALRTGLLQAAPEQSA